MHPSAMTLREGRQAYFATFGLGEGGYEDKWVHLKVGPIPFAFPNTESRKKAVRVHDLHHVLTGYRADWIGEFEISAWEVGSSCRDYVAAWVLNLMGFAAGLLVAPGRVFRAFVRGRHTENLYREGYSEALLEETVAGARARMRLDVDIVPTGADRVSFVAWMGLAWVFSLAVLALHIGPVVALGGWLWGPP
jgi:hypothetical protein